MSEEVHVMPSDETDLGMSLVELDVNVHRFSCSLRLSTASVLL